MSTLYPASKQTFTDPQGTSTLASPDHAALHTDMNDTAEALQDTVGTTAGTNILKNFAAGDFPARINSSNVLQQALSGTINNSVIGTSAITGGTVGNALLGTPSLTVGSDAKGDTYYRETSGALTRLAIGAANTVLKSDGTTPSWGAAISFKQMAVTVVTSGTSVATADVETFWFQGTITPVSASGTVYAIGAFNGIGNTGSAGGRKTVRLRWGTASGGTSGTDIAAGDVNGGTAVGITNLDSMSLMASFTPGGTVPVYIKAIAVKRDDNTGTANWGQNTVSSSIISVETA